MRRTSRHRRLLRIRLIANRPNDRCDRAGYRSSGRFEALEWIPPAQQTPARHRVLAAAGCLATEVVAFNLLPCAVGSCATAFVGILLIVCAVYPAPQPSFQPTIENTTAKTGAAPP